MSATCAQIGALLLSRIPVGAIVCIVPGLVAIKAHNMVQVPASSFDSFSTGINKGESVGFNMGRCSFQLTALEDVVGRLYTRRVVV
jgi:hypothetical protein